MSENKITTISLPRYLKKELGALGNKNDTWVELITLIIAEVKESRRTKEG